MAGSKLRARCKIRECRVPNICPPAAAWPGRRVWFFVVPAGEADERDKDGCRLDQVFGRWVGNVPQTRPSLQTAASCSSSRRNKKRMLPHPTPGKARSRSCELVRIQWQGCLRDDFSLEFIDSLQCTHCQTYDVEQASVRPAPALVLPPPMAPRLLAHGTAGRGPRGPPKKRRADLGQKTLGLVP